MNPLVLVKGDRLSRVRAQVWAANGAPLRILGEVRRRFTVDGMTLWADFLVSDEISEMVLGYDWLRKEGVRWMFGSNSVVIRGMWIPLKTRASIKMTPQEQGLRASGGKKQSGPLRTPDRFSLRTPDQLSLRTPDPTQSTS